MAIFQIEECVIFLIFDFHGYYTICTLIIYAWTILVIIISIGTRESLILAKNYPGIDYKDANGKILMETLNQENSTVFDWKNYHNFSLSWPILMILVANIILSHVLIDIMMTRMVQA